MGGAKSADWRILVPLKRLDQAKTRLCRQAADRVELALAFVLDTVAAAAEVANTYVVTDDSRARRTLAEDSIETVSDDGATDLNTAIRNAAQRFGMERVAILTADLPALRAEELAEALRWAAARPAAFVPDTEGTGTVLLTGPAGRLAPRFGPDSARRHETAGAVRLPGAWPGLRRDVDTPADLAAVVTLGVGNHTAALIDSPTVRGQPGKPQPGAGTESRSRAEPG